MMLLNTTEHMAYDYARAKARWKFLLCLSIGLALLVQMGLFWVLWREHQYWRALTKPWLAETERRQAEVHDILSWKAAVEAAESHQAKVQVNQHLIQILTDRLQDFAHVNLRLIRVKPGYFYCVVEGVSERATQQYQTYLKTQHYTMISRQQIEQAWYLEFKHDGRA